MSELISAMETRLVSTLAGQGVFAWSSAPWRWLPICSWPANALVRRSCGRYGGRTVIGPLLGAFLRRCCPVDRACQAGLGDRRHDCDSAGGKQPAGAARYAQGGGCQSVRSSLLALFLHSAHCSHWPER